MKKYIIPALCLAALIALAGCKGSGNVLLPGTPGDCGPCKLPKQSQPQTK